MHRRLLPLILLPVLTLLLTFEPAASDLRPGIEISEAVYVQDNYLDRGDLERVEQFNFTRDVAFNLIAVYPSLSFTLARGFEGYVQGDIYLEHHFDDVEEDESDAELTSAYLSMFNRRASLDIGIQAVQFGNGRILTDEGPAVDVRIKSGDAYLNLTAAQVLDRSPVVGLTLGHTPGFLEQISVFGIWLNDQDDALAQSIPLIFQVLLEPESEGDLYWIGASADLFVGKALFSLVGAYQYGEMTLFNETNRASFDVAGYFADLSLEANLSPSWSAGVFCVLASGDDTPRDRDINAFVSVQPYNPRAAIFFDADFLDFDEEDRLTFGAGWFGGVIAPGLVTSFAPTEGVRLDATLATFYAQEDLNDGSHWYGWEVDLGISYQVKQYHTIFGQAARFWHGDYFESLLDKKIDPATRLVVGIKADF